jgi:hypothetical protein
VNVGTRRPSCKRRETLRLDLSAVRRS